MTFLPSVLAVLALGGAAGPVLSPSVPMPGARPVPSGVVSLTGTTWTLVKIDPGRGPFTLGTALPRPTLRLLGSSAVITTSCGSQTVPFTRDGAALRFPRVGAGGSACPDAALSLHEDYLTLLRRTTRFTLAGRTLTLNAGTGTLVFQAAPTPQPPGGPVTQPPSPQQATTRELVVNRLSLNGKMIPVPPTAKVRLTTTAAGKVTLSASMGCNTMNAEGTLTGSVLRFGPVAATKMMCGDMAAETAFLALLQGPLTVYGRPDAPRWDSPRGALELSTLAQAPGEPAAPSGMFTLTRLNGQPAPATARPVTMTFDGGRIGGTGGCNSYSGQYTVKGGALVVSKVVGTMMLCPDMEAVNLIALFRANPTLTQVGAKLTLNAPGQVWEFTRQP